MIASIENRFWSKVDRSAGPDKCWLWTGGTHRSGYGHFHLKTADGRKTIAAHRFSLEIALGRPILRDRQALHKPKICTSRSCVNPSHLYEGTLSDNALDRKLDGTDKELRKSMCPKGHPYDRVVNCVSFSRPKRGCRACNRLGAAKARSKYSDRYNAARRVKKQDNTGDSSKLQVDVIALRVESFTAGTTNVTP